MSNDFSFAISSIDFDENYQPLEHTRITTNFANLARGESRQQNLRSLACSLTAKELANSTRPYL